ncbi:MAG: Flp family type IVb pilin [Acidimicrobiia bacterium]|nr:Flp family type IVb pilin [Acidimicrobiia bacterium]
MLSLTIRHLTARLRDEESGASLVEYALLIALIAIVCIAAVTLLGSTVQEPYSELSSAL